jgi:hypothetical protein
MRVVTTVDLAHLVRVAESHDFAQHLRSHVLARVAPHSQHILEPMFWHRGSLPAPPQAVPWPKHFRCRAAITMDDGRVVTSLLDTTPREYRRVGRRVPWSHRSAFTDKLRGSTSIVKWLQQAGLADDRGYWIGPDHESEV